MGICANIAGHQARIRAGDGMVMVDMHEYVLGDGGYAGILYTK